MTIEWYHPAQACIAITWLWPVFSSPWRLACVQYTPAQAWVLLMQSFMNCSSPIDAAQAEGLCEKLGTLGGPVITHAGSEAVERIFKFPAGKFGGGLLKSIAAMLLFTSISRVGGCTKDSGD